MTMGRTLAANVWVGAGLFLAGTNPPVEVAAQITNPDAWTAGEAEAPTRTSPAPTKAEMLAEIANRNEGRDEADLIVPESQKNADLTAALKADDERSAGDANGDSQSDDE